MEDAKANKTGPENANSGPPGLRTRRRAIVPEEASGNAAPQPGPNNSAGVVTFLMLPPLPKPGKPAFQVFLQIETICSRETCSAAAIQIWSVLGEGGMGAVDQALDREVDHLVRS